MRPNTPKLNNLVKISKGSGVTIYAIPQGKILQMYPNLLNHSDTAGTPLPDDLILVHEFKDHYSLQASKEMTLLGEQH